MLPFANTNVANSKIGIGFWELATISMVGRDACPAVAFGEGRVLKPPQSPETRSEFTENAVNIEKSGLTNFPMFMGNLVKCQRMREVCW